MPVHGNGHDLFLPVGGLVILAHLVVVAVAAVAMVRSQIAVAQGAAAAIRLGENFVEVVVAIAVAEEVVAGIREVVNELLGVRHAGLNGRVLILSG